MYAPRDLARDRTARRCRRPDSAPSAETRTGVDVDFTVGESDIEITATVLRQKDGKSGGALVDAITDEAEQKGTGRWTVQIALELGVPVVVLR